MRKIEIPETEIVIQKEEKSSGTEIIIHTVTDDGGCVMASWSFAGKSFNQVLWDENSTPSYADAGQWTDEDVNSRIIEFINK